MDDEVERLEQALEEAHDDPNLQPQLERVKNEWNRLNREKNDANLSRKQVLYENKSLSEK